MVELITGLRAERVRGNLERVREQIAAAGRDPAEVQILPRSSTSPSIELPVLAEAGIELVGENRAQDLVAKAQAHPGLFTWDFIGHLQSRKVRQILRHVRLIHSRGQRLGPRAARPARRAETEVLVEVNVAGEAGKSGIAPERARGLPRALPGAGESVS